MGKHGILYDYTLLMNVLVRDEAQLCQSIPEPLNSVSKLLYKCKCGKENSKRFEWMFKNGCLCEDCMKVIKENKKEETCLQRYGNRHSPLSFQTPQSQEKRVNTFLERYGTTHLHKVPGAMKKRKETCLARFGVDNPSKSNVIKAKITAGLIKHHAKRKASKTSSKQPLNPE
jgi:hypothetical protein